MLFGVPGDLADRKLLPAAYQMTARGQLEPPVIGVAASRWDDQQLLPRGTDAVMTAVPDADPGMLAP